ncbi:FadR family transcriptional regulator [Alsobacter sp. SYSU M60028]|uniref:FadR family transcriptional regulator n=1 Tax=Alsobacter ponti TaxID=2962936 RepID=A0ABT1LEW8_9HYPH|nr:FadR family transcriptional regulator [Alsobacter ponti]
MVKTGGKVMGNLGTQVAALLGRRIVSGELEPGATLPTEAELCDRYGVSRTTIRDALKRLHGKGLIVGTARAGTRVLPTSRWSQFDADLLTWRLEAGLDTALIQELHEIRQCFEPEACRVAARHASPEDHARIRAAFDEMAACRETSSLVMEADLEFHMAIVDATHNRFFITLGQAVKTALRVSFGLLRDRPGLPDNELAMHGDIADCIVEGRGDDAARTMRDLISLARRNIDARIGAPTPSRPA